MHFLDADFGLMVNGTFENLHGHLHTISFRNTVLGLCWIFHPTKYYTSSLYSLRDFLEDVHILHIYV